MDHLVRPGNRRDFLRYISALALSPGLLASIDPGEQLAELVMLGPKKPKIFFVQGESSTSEIWTMDENGQNLEQITHNSFEELSPAVSPNGRFLAYAHNIPGSGYINNITLLDLRLAKETANIIRKPRQISGNVFHNYDYGNISSRGLCFSPNNRILAANVYQCQSIDLVCDNWIELFGVDRHTGQVNPAAFFSLKYRAEFPSFSPDGRSLVWGSELGIEIGDLKISRNGDSIEVLNVRTLVERKEYEDIGRPLWSPRGDHILFDAGGAGVHKNKIFMIDADGSQLTEISGKIDSSYTLGSPKNWSPDGTKVAYKDGCVYIVDVDTLDRKAVAGNYVLTGRYNAPCWSLNGKKISFEAKEGIYSANADGTNLRLLKKLPYEDYGRRSTHAWKYHAVAYK